MPTAFRVARLEELDPITVWEGVLRVPLRERLGIRAFGSNAYTAVEPGQTVVEPHEHAGPGGQEELYVVLAGRAAFTVNGRELDAPAGTLVFVRPACRRSATAREAGTTVLVVGAPPDEAYSAPPWPADAGMWRYRELVEAGDLEGAIVFLEGALDRYPGNQGMLAELARCKRVRRST